MTSPFNRLQRLVLAGLLAAVAAAGCAAAPKADRPGVLDGGVRRVVFLGDSITYGGQYIDYLEAYLATRRPDLRVELLNLGLPSETVSGLSEPGHADGKFPRPCLHERLDRVLAKTRPDLVVACYGMNDGIYYPLGEERFAAYREGIATLVRKVRAAGADILILTPPTFDPLPIKARTLPAGRDAYEQPFEGYDAVLARYAAWLLEQRATGLAVADVHGPMARLIEARRRTDPAFFLAGDGVHANSTGHWIFTEQLLAAWHAPAEVDAAEIDAAAPAARQGKITNLAADAGGVRFDWLSRRPMPAAPKWDAASIALLQTAKKFNRHTLTVTGLPAATYRLSEGDTPLGTVTREELATGVDLGRFADLSANRGGPDLLKLIRQRQRLLTDAWLTDTGHLRPMNKGLPLDEATAKAAEIEVKIREAAAPVVLHLQLAPEGAK